jgi:adenylate cyclase
MIKKKQRRQIMGFLRRILRYIFRLSSFRIGIIITFIILILYFSAQLHRIRPLARSGLASALRQLELKAYDMRFRIRGRVPIGDEVVIVTIDEASLDKLGHWPWPRDEWGKFIRNINKYQPKVVAFDVLFGEPDQNVNTRFLEEVAREFKDRGLAEPDISERNSDKTIGEYGEELKRQEKLLRELINALEGSGQKNKKLIGRIQERLSKIKRLRKELDEVLEARHTGGSDWPEIQAQLKSFPQFIEKLKQQSNTDRYFAEALREMPQVVLGWFFFETQWEVEQLEDQDFTEELASLEESSIKSIQFTRGASFRTLVRKLTPMYGMRVNIPILAEKADHFGYFTFTADRDDGVYRKAPLIAAYNVPDKKPPGPENVKVYPLLSLEALRRYLNEDPVVVVDPLGVTSIRIAGRDIPVDEKGRMYINFRGPRDTFPYYSVYDVISDFKEKPDLDPEKIFKDKIVLVGATAIAIYDIRTVPYESMPGIEMHASTIDNILHNQAIIRPSWYGFFDIFFIIAVGFILGLILPRLKPVWGVISTLVLFVGYSVFNYYLFIEKYYSFTILYPLAELVLLYLGITIYHYALEERDKRFIKSAFGYYLSPHVIEQLTENPDKLKLGGERRELTAFFSDIQGFSTISENLSPEDLVGLLNEYLTEMSDIILKYDGTIDKYEGDAIMAFFGAPLDYPDHARRACLAALEQQQQLIEMRKVLREQNRDELFVRMGLNTGAAVVGNMGSSKRMDYTIMGDEVNLASRLEGANKQYRTYIMSSEVTYNSAREFVEARDLGLIRVVGKKVPVRVYELLALKGELDPDKEKVIKAYLEGLHYYEGRDWQNAIAAFSEALRLDPQDGPANTYLDRCRAYLAAPPPPDWDGVFTMTEK